MTDSEKLNLILEKLTTLDEKVDLLDEKVNTLDKKVNLIDEKVNNIDCDLKEVKQKVTNTELIVENEMRVNIQRVAEGHFGLSRKLNECIKLLSDIKVNQEIQDIYVNMHDSKLKVL